MNTTIDKVKEFHLAFGQPVRDVPTVPSYEERLLRIKLAAEELAELAEALGVPILAYVGRLGSNEPSKYENTITYKTDLIAAADALADIAYVNAGTALVCGIPLNACVAEVHRSNMSKLDHDGKPVMRADGKVLKGPAYTPPDLGPILARPQVLDTCEYRAAELAAHIVSKFVWDATPPGYAFWKKAAHALDDIANGQIPHGVSFEPTPTGPQLSEMLVHAFPWHKTPQGEQYWADVAQALEELP